jgi:hypothetical protein
MVINFLLHLSTPCIAFMKLIYILSISSIKMKLIFRDGLTSKQGVIPQGLTCSAKLFKEDHTSAPNHT